MRKPLVAALMTSALAGALLAGHGEAGEFADSDYPRRHIYGVYEGRISEEEVSKELWGGRHPEAAARTQTVAVRGLATWYGWGFDGRVMRNGEVFDAEDETTTASNIFPLGTWLRVTSKATGASIDVRNTDTGAFKYPIIVDLSKAAFSKLADPDEGILEVIVRPLRRE